MGLVFTCPRCKGVMRAFHVDMYGKMCLSCKKNGTAPSESQVKEFEKSMKRGREMTADELRAKFESKCPAPEGVHWDGDHYTGTKNIVGSFSNATIWNDTYRGFVLGFQTGAEWLRTEMVK